MDNNIFTVEIPSSVANLQLPDPALLDYYRDSNERVHWLDGEVDDSTLDLVRAIIRYNKEDEGLSAENRRPVKIFINTIGGDVQVMWSLINAMKISVTPIYTIVYCNALSAGAHILAAGHKRFAMPGSTILIHSGSCQYTGDAEKVESAKRYYDSIGKKANDALLVDTHITARDLKRKGASDWYIGAEDAVALGIVDAIVSDLCEVM